MKKFNNYILIIICVVFAAIAAIDLTLPLYSDEVVVNFNVTNFFAFFGGYVNLPHQCYEPDSINWIFNLAAALMSILFDEDPWLIKITSISNGLFGLILIFLLVRRGSNLNWKFKFVMSREGLSRFSKSLNNFLIVCSNIRKFI